MVLVAKQYISDIGLIYRLHPFNIIDNSPEYPIINYIPDNIKTNIIDLDKSCAINGLTLRKVIITFIDLNESSFDYLIPFDKEYYLQLYSTNEIRSFSFIGERKNNYRIINDFNLLNNG